MFQSVNVLNMCRYLHKAIGLLTVALVGFLAVMPNASASTSQVSLSTPSGMAWLGSPVTNLLPGHMSNRGVVITNTGTYPINTLQLRDNVSGAAGQFIDANISACNGGQEIGSYSPINQIPPVLNLPQTLSTGQQTCIEVSYLLPASTGNQAAETTVLVSWTIGFTYQPPKSMPVTTSVPVTNTPVTSTPPVKPVPTKPATSVTNVPRNRGHIGRSVPVAKNSGVLAEIAHDAFAVMQKAFTTPAGITISGTTAGALGLWGFLMFRRKKRNSITEEYIPLREIS